MTLKDGRDFPLSNRGPEFGARGRRGPHGAVAWSAFASMFVLSASFGIGAALISGPEAELGRCDCDIPRAQPVGSADDGADSLTCWALRLLGLECEEDQSESSA